MINLSSYQFQFFLLLILCTLCGCDNGNAREAKNQTTSSIPNYDPDDWSYESDLVYHKYMAEKNDVKSLEELYQMFSSGLGTKKDYSLAIAYLKKASSLGSYSASYKLASLYEYGVPKAVTRSEYILVNNLEVSANYKKLYISQLAAEAESDPLAAFKLGNRYETLETDVVKSQIYYDKSRVLLEDKVAKNEPYWTLQYATFRGEPKNPSILPNSEESLSLLEKLVEQKYRQAYPYLASVYLGRELPKVREFALQKYGLSNESAYKKAIELLLIGAKKGDMHSIKLLIGYYQNLGKFEKHADEQIIKWADEGIKQSKYNEIDNVKIHAAKINSAYKLRDAELLAKSMLSSLEFEDFTLYRKVSKNSYLLFMALHAGLGSKAESGSENAGELNLLYGYFDTLSIDDRLDLALTLDDRLQGIVEFGFEYGSSFERSVCKYNVFLIADASMRNLESNKPLRDKLVSLLSKCD